MNRREAVKNTAVIMGGVLSASTLSVMLGSCNQSPEKGEGKTFTPDEKKMVHSIADVIIPRTDTPGAVDAGVPAFIVMMMQECYPIKDQNTFHNGLSAYNKWCKKKYGKSFLALSPEKQEKAVSALDKAVLGNGDNNGDNKDKSLSFYRTLKELTLLGFFTSKPGATETLRYVQVPGRYDGCVPYKEGDKAWAT